MKKIASLVCAAMLALALPTLAWAAPSPGNNNTATNNNITANVSDNATIEASNTPAANYSAGNDTTNASYSINIAGEATTTVTFYAGTQNAGRTAHIYIQNADGTTSVVTGIVASDGTIACQLDQSATVTIAIEGAQVSPGASTGGTDKGDTSPQTGADLASAAAATAAMAIAAGGVAVALRKKIAA